MKFEYLFGLLFESVTHIKFDESSNKCLNSQGYMLRNRIYKFILKIVYLILWSL